MQQVDQHTPEAFEQRPGKESQCLLVGRIEVPGKVGGLRAVGSFRRKHDIELLDLLRLAIDEQQPGEHYGKDHADYQHDRDRAPIAEVAGDGQAFPVQRTIGQEFADVGIDVAQRQARHEGEDQQAHHVDHLRQDQPERGLFDAAMFILELTEEDGVDQPEQVQEGDRAGEEDQDHRQAVLCRHDRVVEYPATAEARQRWHTRHGDDADQHRDE